MATPQYAQVPFAAALAYFRAKLAVPTARWDDLLKAAHDKAFVVAGAMDAALLADLKRGVERAIAEGVTVQQFRQDFAQLVTKHGWTGWKGQGSQAGEAWRTRLIYETNLYGAYAAGRVQQQQAMIARRPYWQYKHAHVAVDPREQHLAWDGLILRADDPWWQTHYPPNGFGCKCYVLALNERDLKRLGKSGADPTPEGGDYTHRYPDGRTEVLPDGVDPGWNYLPGTGVGQTFDTLIQNGSIRWGEPLASALVDKAYHAGVFTRWLEGIAATVTIVRAQPELAGLSGAELSRALRDKIQDKSNYPMAVLSDELRTTLNTEARLVHLSASDAIKQAVSREGQDFGSDLYYLLPSVLRDAKLILRQNGTHYAFLPQGRKVLLAILQITGDRRHAYLKSFRYAYGEDEAKRLRARSEVLKDEWS